MRCVINNKWICDAYKFFTDLSNVYSTFNTFAYYQVKRHGYIQIFIVFLSIKINLFPDKTN